MAECMAPVAYSANSNEADFKECPCIIAVAPVAAGNGGCSSGGGSVLDAPVALASSVVLSTSLRTGWD